MPVKLKRRLLTVEEYHLMGEVGILKEKGIELINGEIIEMSPIGSRHAAFVEKMKDMLVIALQGKAIARVQNPIITNTFSEPEPDIAVVKYRSDYYVENHPQAEDTLLLIEVASSSIDYDREIKLPLYASNGIPEVWIMDLNEGQLEVYHTPVGNEYQHKTIAKDNDRVSAQMIELSIVVKDLLV